MIQSKETVPKMKSMQIKHFFCDHVKLITWLTVMMLFLAFIVLAYWKAKYFDAYPYDGPFQHLYPLREMDRGLFPGVDFNFFHGTFLPYINYGIYKLMGGGIFGALFSAKCTQVISIYIGLLFLCFQLFSKQTRLLAFFLIIGLMATETLFKGLAPLWDVSSFGIRTFVSLIIASLLANEFKNQWNEIIGYSLLCALGVYLGSEQGFYCALAFMGILVFTKYANNLKLKLLYLIVFSVMFAIELPLISYLFFGSLKPLLFIKNIADDQVWYYGAPPVIFIRSLGDFFTNPYVKFIPIIVFLSFLAFLSMLFAYKRKIISFGQFNSLLFLMLAGAAGLISDFSIVAYHYSEPLLRSTLIAFLVVICSITEKYYLKNESC
jgi:hypothetical protein